MSVSRGAAAAGVNDSSRSLASTNASIGCTALAASLATLLRAVALAASVLGIVMP